MDMKSLTSEQLRKLAKLIGSTPNSLRQIGRSRGASSQMAIRIERGARRMRLDIRREDISSGCAGCEFAKKCRGST